MAELVSEVIKMQVRVNKSDDQDKAVVKSYSFGNINNGLSDTDVEEMGAALGALFNRPYLGVARVNTAIYNG